MFTFPVELWVLNRDYLKIGAFRTLGFIIVAVSCYFWESDRNKFHVWIPQNSGAKISFKKWVADGFAMAVYRVPIFWLCAIVFLIFGEPISIYQTVLLTIAYTIENVVFIGGLSGIILDWLHELNLRKTFNCLWLRIRASISDLLL